MSRWYEATEEDKELAIILSLEPSDTRVKALPGASLDELIDARLADLERGTTTATTTTTTTAEADDDALPYRPGCAVVLAGGVGFVAALVELVRWLA